MCAAEPIYRIYYIKFSEIENIGKLPTKETLCKVA